MFSRNNIMELFDTKINLFHSLHVLNRFCVLVKKKNTMSRWSYRTLVIEKLIVKAII